MSKTTKIIIYLVIAFVIIIVITFAVSKSDVGAPASVTDKKVSAVPPPVATEKYTLAEVANHSTKADCWTAINGSVYNVTAFIPNHPGGDKILAVCGKDGTVSFTGQHGGQPAPEKMLTELKIGILK